MIVLSCRSIPKQYWKVIIGYRFLVSAGFLDILMLFNYGIWPGMTIVLKSEIIPKEWRHWLQLYLDWAWFSMVWHITLVAWSRWSAIRSPYSYKYQRRLHSYALCGCFCLASLAEAPKTTVSPVVTGHHKVLATHFQSWYVTFYYEPSTYGMLAEDISLYLSGGQSTMFLINHMTAIILAIIFYTWSVILLTKLRSAVSNESMYTTHTNVEKRLLIPCVINMVVFSVGQVVIALGTGHGKWTGFLVMLTFCTKSALNLYLLLIFSKSLRFVEN
uniref:G protein-coupled receptor n=1 Tax=Angiostrongylus cantonensis TaxID=6313 RepID=A0A0K0CWQ8_ANGCA